MNPVCPRCAEICDALEERCECGERLYMTPRTRKPQTRIKVSVPKVVECLCGCGETFLNRDKQNRLRRYVCGHNLNAKPPTPLSPAVIWWASQFTNAEIQEMAGGLA